MKKLFTLTVIMIIKFIAIGQTVQTFTANGTFTVPAGVTSIQVEVWGAGGGGGGATAPNGGGGGGGGAYSLSNLNVSGGEVYTVSVAGIANGGNSTSAGNNGGASVFSGPGGMVIANGGSGGQPNLGSGGSGGTGTYKGGNGGTGDSYGAGGGGGAGNAGSGGNGSTAATGSAGLGGIGIPNSAPYKGGNGGSRRSSGNGSAGATPGGGGGGGRGGAWPNQNVYGGTGARGQVVVTFTYPPCTGTPNSGSINISSSSGCSGINFTITNTDISLNTGLTYQWEKSPDGLSNWSNISGATNPNLTTSTTSTTYFRLLTTCINSGLNNYSNLVSYTTIECCNHQLVLWDNGSNGWQGGYIYLYVNGNLIGSYTVYDGYGGLIYNFGAGNGTPIQIIYYPGGNPEQNGFHVLGGGGTYNYLATNIYPYYTGTVNINGDCPVAPLLTSLGTNSGCIGSTITINGTNLMNANSVKIGGTIATILTNSDTVITANISYGTSGDVVVATKGGPSNGLPFTVLSPPPITLQPLAPSGMCPGVSTSTISVAGTGATTFQWYKNGIALSNIAPYSGVTTSTLTITAPSVSENGEALTCVLGNGTGCYSTTESAILVVNPASDAPTSLTATPGNICSGTTSNLNAISSLESVDWWTEPTGGSFVGNSLSGANLAVNPLTTTTYYAETKSMTISGSETFNFTGSVQTFTVPAFVNSIAIDAYGAQGGNNINGSTGGLGGRIQATSITVTPGQVLYIHVGGAGTMGGNAAGGYNGGGGSSQTNTTGSGGGATDLRIGSNTLSNRIIVSGGGGGAGENCGNAFEWGGAGGGLIGANGWLCNVQNAYSGGGGTQSAGGAYGNDLGLGCGGSGSLGLGGQGSCDYGGGGGGGYYGGGGGGFAGGGGGSSYTTGTIITNQQGVQSGNGKVIISWNVNRCVSATRTPVTVDVNTYTYTENHAICTGEIYNWHGQNFTTTGIYNDNHQTALGCDSTYTLNLTVFPLYNIIETQSICLGDSISWHGQHLKTAGTYTANYQNTNGCDSTYTLHLIINPAERTLNVKALLEGLCAGSGLMNQSRGISGPQFGADIADKVSVELHNARTPFDIVYEEINIDLFTDGMLTISALPCNLGGLYYLVIKHHNSIETWSNTPLDLGVSGPFTYDFSNSSSQAYGNNLKPMGSIYAIFSGDASQDGIIDGTDMALIDNASAPPPLMGYYPEDVNGDGIVDGTDMAIIDNNSSPPPIQVKRP